MTIIIPRANFKTNRTHTVYMHPGVKWLLQRRYQWTGHCAYVFAKPNTKLGYYAYPSKGLESLCDGTRITRPISMNIFRHTFATYVIAANVHGRLISGMPGHGGSRNRFLEGAEAITTRVYASAPDTSLRDACIQTGDFMLDVCRQIRRADTVAE